MNMKILRLSLFNLKKNKREAFSVMLLTAITMLLMGIAVCNIIKSDTVFDERFEKIGSVENLILFPLEKYREEYKEILKEDGDVTGIVEADALFEMNASHKKGEQEIGTILVFVTENSEKKLEKFSPETDLTEDEIHNLSHPIWLPSYFKYSQKYEVGNPFIIMLGGKEYPFEIAGFYESGLLANTGMGIKCVISEEDYQLLSLVTDEKKVLAYNSGDMHSADEYLEKCAEYSSENIGSYCIKTNKEVEKANTTKFIKMFLAFMLAAAFITMISCLFMIRHKISNDIEDQMQSIGVLEALGYKSKEISLAYLYEYVLTGGIGAIFGIVLVIVSDQMLNRIIEVLVGYRVDGRANLGIQLGIMCVLVLVIVLFALGKAKTVKKYPPVVAFRKGIHTHHFKRNILPLSKAKGDINLRLSMKELFSNTRQNIGMMICIFATAIAILSSFYMLDFLKTGVSAVVSLMGMEVGDVRAELMPNVDPYGFEQNMLEFPEVRKTLVTYADNSVSVKDNGKFVFSGMTVVYDDYRETENIHLKEGRYPEHDNEIMITFAKANSEGYSIGDSITIEAAGIENSYIITGIVNSMANNGVNVYFSSEGFQRSFPSARPCVVEVYLKEDVDRHEFGEKLTALYGGSVEDYIKEGEKTDDYAERIRQVADEKMAQLIFLYGVTDVDYAIKIGDTIITGNSEKFVLRGVSSLLDLAEGQIKPVADGMRASALVIVSVSVIIAVVILSNLAHTVVKRKRKELGIMKSMGYTSKDLMKQIALRMMPIAGVAVIIASVCSVYLMNAFGIVAFKVIIDANYWIMVPIDICLLLFCYLVTYISAGKIKEISVTELMTE